MARPSRYLFIGLSIVLTVSIVSVIGYMMQGWSFIDSLYMVVITIFTVGYAEVQTVNTPEMKIFTMLVITAGCTGLIFLTSALIQYLTEGQINRLLERRKMTREVSKLKDHVIICGFGRIGHIIATELKNAECDFIIVEKSNDCINEARSLNYLVLKGDATDETALIEAGIKDAKTLAVILPDDVANVFITLSAKNLNPNLEIIARGEKPNTEKKLLQAGATRVVLPAYIGGERVANMILFPNVSERLMGDNKSTHLENEFSKLGLGLEKLIISENSPLIGEELQHMEADSNAAFLVIAIHKKDGRSILEPPHETILEMGDGLVLICHKGIFSEFKKQFAAKES